MLRRISFRSEKANIYKKAVSLIKKLIIMFENLYFQLLEQKSRLDIPANILFYFE